jgi:hypothetical protein
MDEVTEFNIDLVADGYFNGGNGPYKFELTGVTHGADDEDLTTTMTASGFEATELTGSIDEETNMLNVELVATTQWTDPHYMSGFTIHLKATDANQESATSSVTIKPNRAPTLDDITPDEDGSLPVPNDAYVLGTMAGDIDIDANMDENQPRPDGAASCTTFNSCELTLFEDDGELDFDVAVVSDASDSFSWESKDGKLVLTGLQATEEDVEVEVRATDSNELSSPKYSFMLSVSGAPTVSEAGQGVSKTVTVTLADLMSGAFNIFRTEAAAQAAFSATEGTPITTVMYKSANESIVKPATQTTGDEAHVLTAEGRGSTTVTVRGITGVQGTPDSDGLGQYAEIVFTVVVN